MGNENNNSVEIIESEKQQIRQCVTNLLRVYIGTLAFYTFTQKEK